MNTALKRFEAREQIENILLNYTDALDSGDLKRFSDIFERGSLIIQPAGFTITGAEANLEAVRHAVIFYDANGNPVTKWIEDEGHTPRTSHIISNIRFSFDKAVENAEVHSYLTVYQTITEPKIIVSGRYHDVFKCHNDMWHLSERNVYLTHMGDVSHHLRGA